LDQRGITFIHTRNHHIILQHLLLVQAITVVAESTHIFHYKRIKWKRQTWFTRTAMLYICVLCNCLSIFSADESDELIASQKNETCYIRIYH
jgi:hypothetical protein